MLTKLPQEPKATTILTGRTIWACKTDHPLSNKEGLLKAALLSVPTMILLQETQTTL